MWVDCDDALESEQQLNGFKKERSCWAEIFTAIHFDTIYAYCYDFSFIDDLTFFCIDIRCEPINLGMLAKKTKTGDMMSVCCIWTILANIGGCQLCYAPGVINKAVAKYGVTEEPVSCPTYCLCGACLTCRAHREVRLVYCKVIVSCCIMVPRQVVHSTLFFFVFVEYFILLINLILNSSSGWRAD